MLIPLLKNARKQEVSKYMFRKDRKDRKEREDRPRQQLAKNFPELLDKYIFSRKSLPYELSTLLLPAVLLYDNYMNRLPDWEALWWSLQKAFVIFAVCLFAILLQPFLEQLLLFLLPVLSSWFPRDKNKGPPSP